MTCPTTAKEVAQCLARVIASSKLIQKALPKGAAGAASAASSGGLAGVLRVFMRGLKTVVVAAEPGRSSPLAASVRGACRELGSEISSEVVGRAAAFLLESLEALAGGDKVGDGCGGGGGGCCHSGRENGGRGGGGTRDLLCYLCEGCCVARSVPPWPPRESRPHGSYLLVYSRYSLFVIVNASRCTCGDKFLAISLPRAYSRFIHIAPLGTAVAQTLRAASVLVEIRTLIDQKVRAVWCENQAIEPFFLD